MGTKESLFRGALLGLAVGDALGRTVDSRNLDEIFRDYGPNGLLGYDLVNGYADVSSYTQLAAFSANGLLMGMTRGQVSGRVSGVVRYISTAIREWSRSQTFSEPERNCCWMSGVPAMKRRFCMDTRMLDALTRETLGTLEQPQYRSDHPGALTTVLPIALLHEDLGLNQEELDRASAEVIALTHGEPEAFLTGAALTHLMCGLLQNPDAPLRDLVQQTIHSVQYQFGHEYGQGTQIWEYLQLALTLAESDHIAPTDAMQTLGCHTAGEVLAGAVYALATCEKDFDRAVITAVNHSGRSAAVGALTGCMLGAITGEGAIPLFYLDGLEPAETLMELAEDLTNGFSQMVGKSLFDVDWDRKYLRVGV